MFASILSALRIHSKHVVVMRERPNTSVECDAVHVDRTARIAHPMWMEKVLHPDLQMKGPLEYDLARVNLWLHQEQKYGAGLVGRAVYQHLLESRNLKSCLGLEDGWAIQHKGIATFHKYFSGRMVCLWKSVAMSCAGDVGVPCLLESRGEVMIGAIGLDRDLDKTFCAALF